MELFEAIGRTFNTIDLFGAIGETFNTFEQAIQTANRNKDAYMLKTPKRKLKADLEQGKLEQMLTLPTHKIPKK